MKILLDTNIIIHREANRILKDDIGVLFNWVDKLHHTKCYHPVTVEEIEKNPNKETVRVMKIKLESYHQLKTVAPLNPDVKAVSDRIDKVGDLNDQNDTLLLNEVYNNRVDALITEDKKIHYKAELLGISDKVYKVEEFIEKSIAENPSLVDYKVLSVRQEYFGNINLADSFFDSFREDYVGFDKWFNSKSDDIAYIFTQENNLLAFLYVKLEEATADYGNISPAFSSKRRLKIGTLKVVATGLKLGERFLKIAFDNARRYKVDEIYVTIFDKRPEQKKLIELLEEFGFVCYGKKTSSSGEELVYVREFKKHADRQNPRVTFPWLSKEGTPFIVPIKPEYHTELFPDSILRTESPMDFTENEPHRNAISKVYVSHSQNRSLQPGDTLIFYRSGGIHKGVATTIGIVENIITNLNSLDSLKQACLKRTVLTDEELKEYWERFPRNRPFVINFLYAFSFRKRLNLKSMLDNKILPSMDTIKTITPLDWNSVIQLINLSGI